MTLRNCVSVISGALLLAGLGLQQANAQTFTETFPMTSFAVDGSTGEVYSAAFLPNGDGYYFSAGPTGPAVESLGVIVEPLEFELEFGNAGPPGLEFIVFGTGDLDTVAGATSFTADPGYTLETAVPNPAPDLFAGDFDFTFVGTPTPTVVGTTTVVGGVSVTTGIYGSDFGTGGFINGISDGTGNGVTHISLTAVPEPGTVSLLAGLAVAGSGLALRRRRRA